MTNPTSKITVRFFLLLALMFCHLSQAADCNPASLRGTGWTSGNPNFLWDRTSNFRTSMFAKPVDTNKPLQLGAVNNSKHGGTTLVFLDTSNVAKFQTSVDQLVDDFSFGVACSDADGRDLFDLLGELRDKDKAAEMEKYLMQRGGAARKEQLNQIAAQKAAEQKRQEELARLDENKFKAALNHKSPQAMYLAAGSYDRAGETQRANQIYEKIIASFPESTWAVKANDQLIATKRVNDASAAASQRQYEAQKAADESDRNAKNQCYFRIDKCKDSCGYGSGRYPCTQRCESICSAY